MKKSKTYKISRSSNIGSPDAETDDILFDVFVDIDNLSEIMDVKNQKSILIGRTGSGKSAVVKYLVKNCEKITQIEPEAMSLRFLSNSTILKYFKSLDVNLNLFYKILWKHVFVVELLKMYFEDFEDERKKSSFFQNLIEKLKKTERKDGKRDRAVKYLENWTTEFWESTEYKISEFEKTIQEKFASELGIDVHGLKSLLNTEISNEEKFRIAAKSKAESIIHSSQASDILDVISIMKDELFNNAQKKFYLVLDDLDKEWIEDSLRYELIGSMIEVVKEFRQFQGVKIVISLRENLNEIVFSGQFNKGGQREKFKPLFSYLTWQKQDLNVFLDKRLKLLSENHLSIKNAFYDERRSHKTGLDYVLERTFHRPRDVISYINHAIENASNKEYFTKDILAKAEPSYSLDRFQALEDEWSENYGSLNSICEFLRGINDGFRLKSLNENQFTEIYCIDKPEDELNGEMLKALTDWKNGSINFSSYEKKILYALYRIGVVGIKKGPTFKTAFYYDRDVLVDRNDITNNSKFYVHPSLYSYFKVNTLAQLPE